MKQQKQILRFFVTLQLMHYIVGLGNPGEKYTNTRHNVGFLMLEQFARDAGLPDFHESSAHSGRVTEGVLEGEDIFILLPSTFMNASGSAVKKLIQKEDANCLVVVYDDVDLPLGQIKVSYDRGAGGHNGVQSIIESLGTREFARIRIGIAHKSFWTGKPVRPKGEQLASYVLKPFSKKELEELTHVQQTFNEAVKVFVHKGATTAMNSYN